MNDFLPLDATKYDLIDRQVSRGERLWRPFPIIGRMMSTILWERRNRPLYDEYCQFLELRPANKQETWGNSERQKIGKAICVAAQSQIGWPNDRLTPSDPIRIALWSFHDGLDAQEAILEIEEQLNVKIPWNELVKIWNKDLDSLVDLILFHQTA